MTSSSPRTARCPGRILRPTAVLGVIGALALAAGGCGSSSKSPGSGASSAPATGAPAPTTPPTSTSTGAPGGGSSASAGPAAPASAAKVAIASFKFQPPTITVSKGAKVTFTNNDSAEHTATAIDSSFDSGTLTQGKTKSVTFAKAGTFAYHCLFHAFMTGTVIVK